MTAFVYTYLEEHKKIISLLSAALKMMGNNIISFYCFIYFLFLFSCRAFLLIDISYLHQQMNICALVGANNKELQYIFRTFSLLILLPYNVL